MRGKVEQREQMQISIRITPAYAGKSVAGRASCIYPQDHPRLCGEKIPSVYSDIINLGSPPPMRGKGIITLVRLRMIRITPAYAGKSCCRISFFLRIGDHPRLCGEKHSLKPLLLFNRGSPPPMRGKAITADIVLFEVGITPAYAGKSS